ncbi:MAG: hypothetical protein ABH861_04450 [Patescibacteria group bacterium]|nr:hypothetical protein [Patescibacteria group bacterium]
MNLHYAYIYDDFLSDRGFEREVAALETKLNRYDLAGRIGRLALFRDPKDLVESMVNQGATTIVIVGNDNTLDKVMWFLPNLDVTVGYIPLAGPSVAAKLLNIPVGIDACDILSARLVESLDLGKLDNRYFLTEAEVPAEMASLDVEGKYKVSAMGGGSLIIRNLGGRRDSRGDEFDGKDGFLEAIIISQEEERKPFFRRRKEKNDKTRILFKHGKLLAKFPVEVRVDNQIVKGSVFDVSIGDKKIKMITGRGRRSVQVEDVLPKRKKNGNFSSAASGIKRPRKEF